VSVTREGILMAQQLCMVLRWAVIVALLAVRGNALAAPPAAGASAAERLADGLAAHQATTDTPGTTATPADKSPAADKSGTVSMLDVAAKLALLVLAVYGIAYGLKIAQRSGFSFRPASQAAPQRRLRSVEELALRAGVALHLVEVDGQALVVATAPGGVVSVVMEAAAEPVPQPEEAPQPTDTPEFSAGFRALRDDADWQTRRDTLIRALSTQTT
jgi:hypothetical protein